MARKSQLPIVKLTAFGVFAPVLGFVAEALRYGLISQALSAMFVFTIVYFGVRILGNKRWDASKKVGWIAAFLAPLLIFPPVTWVVAVYFWWTEVRENNKWANLAGMG